MNVSVVIPTYNRKPILEKCLRALEKQKLNKNLRNYEIIVVDNSNNDQLKKKIETKYKNVKCILSKENFLC